MDPREIEYDQFDDDETQPPEETYNEDAINYWAAQGVDVYNLTTQPPPTDPVYAFPPQQQPEVFGSRQIGRNLSTQMAATPHSGRGSASGSTPEATPPPSVGMQHHDIGGQGEGSSSRRQKKTTSMVWKYMERVTTINDKGEEVVEAVCKWCGKHLQGRSSMGTRSLAYHLSRCPMKRDEPSEVSNFSFDPSKHRHGLARFIASNDLPLNFSDNPRFEHYVKEYLQPNFTSVSRVTTRSDIFEVYEIERKNLLNEFSEFQYNVAITSDIWSSKSKDDYISVVAHYVDKNWKLQKRIIGFRHMEYQHTGQNIASKIENVLDEYGLLDKVISITLDNASSNDRAIGILKSILNLHAEGVLLHQRCVPHIINLMVQDGLRSVEPFVEDLREAVRYLNGSNVRRNNFKRYCRANGVEPRSFANDMEVRWNSTYILINKLLPYSEIFTVWYTADRRDAVLTPQHWDVARSIHSFLEVFL